MLISPKRLNFWRFLLNKETKRNLYIRLKHCKESFWIKQAQAARTHYCMEHVTSSGKHPSALEYRHVWNDRN